MRLTTPFALILLLLLGGCSTSSLGKTNASSNLAQYSQAALAWEEGELTLPENSPLVLSFRPSSLVQSGSNLFAWAIEDPALFGSQDRATEMIRFLLSSREQLKESIGFDLLDLNKWPDYGVDLGRPMQIGLYDLPKEGRAFINTYETTMMEALQVPGAKTLGEAVDRYEKDTPKGLHAKLSRQNTASVKPALRWVGEVKEPSKFISAIDRWATRSEALRFEKLANQANVSRVYALLVRDSTLVVTLSLAQENRFAIDFIFWDEVQSLDAAKQEATITQIVTTRRAKPGRPLAPKPLNTNHAIALSFDRENLGHWVKYMGYVESLDSSANVSTRIRDEALFARASYVLSVQAPWESFTKGATQISYEVELPQNDPDLVRIGLNLIADQDNLPLPKVPTPPNSLVPRQRNVGFAASPSITLAPEWKRWLSPQLLQRCHASWFEVDDELQSEGIDFHAMAILPVCLASALSNLEETAKLRGFPTDIVPGAKTLGQIQTVEFALPNGALANYQLNPRWLALVTLDPSLETLDRDAFANFARKILKAFIQEDDEESSEEPTLTTNKITPVGSSKSLLKSLYFWQRDGANPWLLFGKGIAPGTMTKEVEVVKKEVEQERLPHALILKLEPLTLVEITSTFQQNFTSIINWANLARRVGAAHFTITPTPAQPGKSANHIKYEFSLKAPSKLN